MVMLTIAIYSRPLLLLLLIDLGSGNLHPVQPLQVAAEAAFGLLLDGVLVRPSSTSEVAGALGHGSLSMVGRWALA